VDEDLQNFDRFLDIRGKQCPLTFVYTKVQLEKMQAGKILKVITDFRAAFSNIPKSVVKQNLGEIIHQYEEGNEKTFWIKRS
jgi:tRNA 2-thiouridine synthesizing protein A